MKIYKVTLVYTVYAHLEIEAASEDAAEKQAWDKVNADSNESINCGEWEVLEVEEATA